MIEGFEKETGELTEVELSLVPLIASGLKKRIGRGRAITSSEIVEKMKPYDPKFSGPRLRKIVNHIRNNQIVTNLIASSKGYYIAETQEELLKYLKSLNQRRKSIEEVMNSYDLTGRLSL